MNQAIFPLCSHVVHANNLPLLRPPGFAGALTGPCPRKREPGLNHTSLSPGRALDPHPGLAGGSTRGGTSLRESAALLVHEVWQHSEGITANCERAFCESIGRQSPS